MKYKTGFISSIINSRWVVETKNDVFAYKSGDDKGTVSYFNIQKIRVETGIVWDVVNIVTKSKTLHVDGLSGKNANQLAKDLEDKTKGSIAKIIVRNKSSLHQVANDTDAFLQQNIYLSNTDIRKWLSSTPKIGRELSHSYFDPEYLPPDLQNIIKDFIEVTKPRSQKLKDRNEIFVIRTIKKYTQLFSKLEKFPLTDEQKRAVVINEDRNLLIAAAGSGKSSTIVAKAIYLIESGLAEPDEILVLAYNKDAQLEIEERLNKLIGITPRYTQPIKAKTFHGLGMDIILKIDGVKPSISEMASASKVRLSIIFRNIIEKLVIIDPTFASQWVSYLTVYKKAARSLDTIHTYKEYKEYMQEAGAEWTELKREQSDPNKSFNKQLMLSTIDGNDVKSLEELRIANWLVTHGINYEYEKRYVHSTATESHRQYYPDFYYPDADLYHEHFAINEDGVAPKFMRDYEAGVIWKRNLHEEKNTKLIETHSAHVMDGSLEEVLTSELARHGIRVQEKNTQDWDEIIKKAFNPERDTELFSTFLRHFKSNNASINQIRERAKTFPDKHRTYLFLNIFNAIFKAYQSKLESNEEIDFEDQINMANEYLETKKYRHSYKYILVDEFQDISQDRKRMIHALLDQNNEIKLFAVGDDWQSIYRFSGADIDIMTNFPDHFGTTSINKLTHTFRSYQGIVDVASEFVQRNPDQLEKVVKANDDVTSNQVIILAYESQEEQLSEMERLLEKINKKGVSQNKELSVYLLGRYNRLKPIPNKLASYKKNFRSLKIEFKTIHGAKGLEADYVILLNVESGFNSFPSTITDDPLLHLVIPRPEKYPYSEERRLMYVAITRAKRAAFIFAETQNPSTFIIELSEIKRVSVPEAMKRSEPCPECDTGEMKIRNGKFGEFLGCSNYPDCNHTMQKQDESEKINI